MGNKRKKYGNTPVVIGGIKFDSSKEGDRYLVLKEAEEKGFIRNLRLQVPFELIPRITKEVPVFLKTKVKYRTKTVEKATTYLADFVYERLDDISLGEPRWTSVVEDVKGSRSVVTRDFKLKKKLMLWRYGIEVRIVYSATEKI